MRLLSFASAALSVVAISTIAARPAGAMTPDFNHPYALKNAAATPLQGVACSTVSVPMRDGAQLTTDVYVPSMTTRKIAHPVIVERTPYGGVFGAGCFAAAELDVAAFAQNGYVGIVQEVRGTGTSGGVFTPFIQEQNDGYDTIEWAAAQTWSTGKVGMTGGSYLGIDQWMAAIANPPHLVAINPNIAGSDFFNSPVYEQGVSRWSDALNYAPIFIADQITRTGLASGTPPATIGAEIAQFEAMQAADVATYTYALPIASMNAYKPYQEAGYFYNWAAHSTYDAFWAMQDVETHWPYIKQPALIGGASIDLFNIGEIRNFQGMRAQAPTAAARQGTKLYWEAYGHAGNNGTTTFGNDAVPFQNAPVGQQLDFFNYYLKGTNNGYPTAYPAAYVYLLVPPNSGPTGSGEWINADGFPLTSSKTETLYLGSGGRANSSLGNGTLGESVRSAAATDAFAYDPRNPVPTLGGNLLTPDTLLHKTGFQDQSAVELRKDVLVYTSAPLTSDMPVIGSIEASFWAQTSAADTDWTVKVVDVHPDGTNHLVMDRVVRARFRLGSKYPANFITPNVPYQYDLQVGNTATIFRAGHKFRVDISSSNFPKFARNLNTRQNGNEQSRPVVATQTILHDASHKSYITFPVTKGIPPT